MLLPDQRKLMKKISVAKMALVKSHCEKCQMKGEGIKEIVASIKSVLGSAFKTVGPVVLKELVLPFIIKKGKEHAGLGLRLAGTGLSPAGGALKLAGTGLNLAGTGKKAPSRWNLHIKSVAKEKNIPFREAMKIASKTFKKKLN
jgi:hypothetical protein